MSDPCSCASLNFSTIHSHFDLDVSFESKLIYGIVTHSILCIEDSEFIVLDNLTKIIQVEIKLDEWTIASFDVLEKSIKIHWNLKKQQKLEVRIKYETQNAEALQWLTKEQTVGKKHPYLFTQSQAIHARSFFPCQDTPAVKFTYTAQVVCPMVALMSAISKGKVNGAFLFEQKMKVPAYLVALAVGNLKGVQVGPRSHVYSEPEVVQIAAKEFEDIEKIILAGEKLLDMEYMWTCFDILVLPSSFPYGGMENPNLTFATPTLLAGDKSLVNVIIHEFAHSYSGNLVTNMNWSSFWLNEGWTMFLERKIVEALFGKKESHLSAILGLNDLERDLNHFGVTHPYTALCPNLENTDPDDVFSTVPYEKGFNFLFYLESILGNDFFLEFTRSYFKRFQNTSVSTMDWKTYLLEYTLLNGSHKQKDALHQVDWQSWLYNPGFPPQKNNFDSCLVEDTKKLAQKWLSGQTEFLKMCTSQTVLFLETIEDQVTENLLQKLDETFNFSSANFEIRFVWFRICLIQHHDVVYPFICDFLAKTGRMKYVRPLYRALKQAKGVEVARNLFNLLKNTYHSICAKMIERDLN